MDEAASTNMRAQDPRPTFTGRIVVAAEAEALPCWRTGRPTDSEKLHLT